MYGIIRGGIGVVLGIAFCIMQATGSFGNGHSNGYLLGGLLIAFGAYRIFRGINQG